MGNPHPKPGPGRPKGSQNRMTSAVKEAFQYAFDGMGGTEKLKEWAMANPTEFYKLYSKLIPTDTVVTVNSHEAALDELR